MNNQIKKFKYNENEIEFDTQNEIMVNATNMAKIFDKRIDVFLKTQPTRDFIDSILKFPPTGGNLSIESEKDLLISTGRNGTWMHRILALKFAAWLNSDFEVWVYSTIDNLLFGNKVIQINEILEDKKYIQELYQRRDVLIEDKKSIAAEIKEINNKLKNTALKDYSVPNLFNSNPLIYNHSKLTTTP